MRTRLRAALPVAFALAFAAPASGMGGAGDGGRPAAEALEGPARRPWLPLLEEGARVEMPAAHLEHTAAHLAASGLSPQEARTLLEPALRAAREGLPAGAVLAKVDEGSLKGVTPDALRQAAQGRLQVLRRAREMLRQRGYPDGTDRGKGLVVSVGLALESGLGEAFLASALDQGAGAPPGQMKAVVEAGESLYLAGLDAATVGTVMNDCLERNLRRPEVLRVVRLAREKLAAGLRGRVLRDALWGDPGDRRGGAGATGGRFGPGGGAGPGGPGGGFPGAGGPHRGGQR